MRLLLSLIVIAAILSTGIFAISYVQTALADKIDCEGTELCIGTHDHDIMIGDDGRNNIFGCNGDDVILGMGGNDRISGDGGVGKTGCLNTGGHELGADKIEGGAGDDIIFHARPSEEGGPTNDRADGQKDIIDCGPGNDEVYINTRSDHDVAINCEKIHSDLNP